MPIVWNATILTGAFRGEPACGDPKFYHWSHKGFSHFGRLIHFCWNLS
jgi:hypothetical protein